MSQSPVWLGIPQRGSKQENVLDSLTTKIGGKAVLFRAVEGKSDATFKCPKCKSSDSVSLVAQLYAPINYYDRVLYVLLCGRCTSKNAEKTAQQQQQQQQQSVNTGPRGGAKIKASTLRNVTSYCFALRSQNFNRDYYEEVQLVARKEAEHQAQRQQASKEAEKPLFDEDADWGDDGADDWDSSSSSSTSASPVAEAILEPPAPSQPEPEPAEESFSLAPSGTAASLGGPVYTHGVPLNFVEEPEDEQEKKLKRQQQKTRQGGDGDDSEEEVVRIYGEGARVDATSIGEEDDETPAERCLREYMSRMDRAPSQCVRWCPAAGPLRTSLTPITVPACAACGAPRQFEMQLTAPAVYFLTREVGGEENNMSLHFSNVLVYTCSQNCYTQTGPYTPEYVVVEDEV